MNTLSSLYIVILAGGKGERLWPLSREQRPKQLLACGSEESLLGQTIDRVKDLVPQEHLWIMTTEQQHDLIKNMVGSRVGLILTEPASRNTAPAILLTCLKISSHNPEASVVFLPADHFIQQADRFIQSLQQALENTKKTKSITLLGLKPTYAATGYGYIEYTPISHESAHRIIRFHEKPSLATAQEYIQCNTMLWNIGVFCGPVKTFIEEYKKTAPHLYEQVCTYSAGNASYDSVENISIDHAIMEKSNNIYVVPSDFQWSDVGNLVTFLSLEQKEQTISSNIIALDATKNLVDAKDKLVVLLGVKELCIIETDDVLLIAEQSEIENIKRVVQCLKIQKLDHYL